MWPHIELIIRVVMILTEVAYIPRNRTIHSGCARADLGYAHGRCQLSVRFRRSVGCELSRSRRSIRTTGRRTA